MNEKDLVLVGDARLVRMSENVIFPWLDSYESRLVSDLCNGVRSGAVDPIKAAQITAVRDLRDFLTRIMKKGEAVVVRMNAE